VLVPTASHNECWVIGEQIDRVHSGLTPDCAPRRLSSQLQSPIVALFCPIDH